MPRDERDNLPDRQRVVLRPTGFGRFLPVTVLPLPPPPLPVVKVEPRIDERCFTFCTQRSNFRAVGKEPSCHTFCWRKVWEYERKLIDVVSFPDRNMALQITVPSNINLDSPTLTPEEQGRMVEERLGAQWKHLERRAAAMRLPQEPPSEEDVAALQRELELCRKDKHTMVHLPPHAQEEVAQIMSRIFKERFTVDSIIERKDRDAADLEQRLAEAEALRNKWTHHPFPPVKTSFWSFLQGHYIFYSRTPAYAGRRWNSMAYLGGMAGFEPFVEAMRKEGREVSAVIDNVSHYHLTQARKEPKAMGLREVVAEARRARLGRSSKEKEQEAEEPQAKVVLISLEHVPPMIYDHVKDSISQVFQPAVSFLKRYQESFVSGKQAQNAQTMWERVWDPEKGVMGTLRKVHEALERKKKMVEEKQAEKERERKGEK